MPARSLRGGFARAPRLAQRRLARARLPPLRQRGAGTRRAAAGRGGRRRRRARSGRAGRGRGRRRREPAARCSSTPTRAGPRAVARACGTSPRWARVPVAITDCLNFGNPEVAGGLLATSSRRCAASATPPRHRASRTRATPLPVVSGNVSFYNQSAAGERDPAVADRLLRRRRSTTARGTSTAAQGATGARSTSSASGRDELGGQRVLPRDLSARSAPACRRSIFARERAHGRRRHRDARGSEWLRACHDVAEGGLASRRSPRWLLGARRGTRSASALDLDALAPLGLGRREAPLRGDGRRIVVEVAARHRARDAAPAAREPRGALQRSGRCGEAPRLEVVAGETMARWKLDELRARTSRPAARYSASKTRGRSIGGQVLQGRASRSCSFPA